MDLIQFRGVPQLGEKPRLVPTSPAVARATCANAIFLASKNGTRGRGRQLLSPSYSLHSQTSSQQLNHVPSSTFCYKRGSCYITRAAPDFYSALGVLRNTSKSESKRVSFGAWYQERRIPVSRVYCAVDNEEEVNNLGVNVALSMLKFYKRDISPLLPSSCRYVPTCSEYSMQAYKRYGVVKGTILTAWRLCRCNPLGGYGYDPPRWFGEEDQPPQ